MFFEIDQAGPVGVALGETVERQAQLQAGVGSELLGLEAAVKLLGQRGIRHKVQPGLQVIGGHAHFAFAVLKLIDRV